MGQDPDTIRREIEQTRERMGETVDALGYKADVPSRTKEAVTGRVSSVKEAITGRASDLNEATPGAQDVKHAARKGAGIAQENPLGLAVGSIAVGFLAGMLIPSTRVENEKIGPMADQLKEQARETGQEALDRAQTVASQVAGTAQEAAQQVVSDVKDSAQEAAGQVKETAQSTAQEQASELKDSAQQSAQQATQSPQSPSVGSTH